MTLWQIQAKSFSLKFRLAYLGVGIAAFLIAFSTGASGVKLSDEEANQIVTEFTERVQGIQEEGIFSNNAVVGLGMFIPAAGAGIGAYSAYSTGIVFNAFAHTNPAIAAISPLSLLATPFGILEIFSYGLAMSRSGMLVYYLVKRRTWKEYLLVTGIEIAIAVSALMIGALIEGEVLRQATINASNIDTPN